MSGPARTFMLVAGAWHGSWCWQRLTPLLEAAGHCVLTPELPGTGASPVNPAHASLDSWARLIAELVRAQPEPVILIGHSRGGAVLSRAAEMNQQNLQLLVYLSAYLLPRGGSVAAAARADADSLIPANMLASESGVTCTLRPEILRDAFYGDCDAETFAFARARLTPEPLKPLATPLKISTELFGAVPRAYVECTRDRTISLAAQRLMQRDLPCSPVLTLESDHSPMLSHPRELAEWLGRL